MLLLAPAPSALAQTGTIEEVVVTGSRIPRTDLDGVAPVTIYTEADIDRTGATSIGQLLREIPSVSGGASDHPGSTTAVAARCRFRFAAWALFERSFS